MTFLLKILTRELSINIHALNVKNKHILFYDQTHQLSHHKQRETASDDHLSYLLTLHILNTKPIDVLTILPKILTRELSINIHALNAKNKHILIYGQAHQLSHQKQQETASDDRLSYLISILNMAK